MENGEKEMWDWLCDDMDAWSEYTKIKGDEKDVQNNGKSGRTTDKFDSVNSRISLYLSKYRNSNN